MIFKVRMAKLVTRIDVLEVLNALVCCFITVNHFQKCFNRKETVI